MKIPIEFVEADESEAYRSLTTAITDMAAVTPSFDGEKVKLSYILQQASFTNTYLLDNIIRIKNLDNLLALVESLLRVENYEVEGEIVPSSLKELGLVETDELQTGLGQIELMRAALSAKLNSLSVAIMGYSRQVRHALSLSLEYSAELTTLAARLEELEAIIRSLDTEKYRFAIETLEKIALDLNATVSEMLAANNVFALGNYHLSTLIRIKDYVRKVEEDLIYMEATYEYLYRKYSLLHTDLREMQADAKRLYTILIDGAYIRSGKHVRVGPKKNKVGVYEVSAERPPLKKCPEPEPWYKPQEVVVIKEEVVCPTQPPGSPLGGSGAGGKGGTGSGSGSGSGSVPVTTKAPDNDKAIENLNELQNCNPSYAYWSKEQSADYYVKRLLSGGAPLSPSNPAHVKAATDYWLNNPPRIRIEDTSRFYYGISVLMSEHQKPSLVVGNSSKYVNGAADYEASISDFYRCLYSLFKTSLKANGLGSSFTDWDTFNAAAGAAGLASKYNKTQLVSFYLTYKWQAVVDLHAGFEKIVNSTSMINEIANSLTGSQHACQRISMCEADKNGNIMGYAIQTNGYNVRVVNMEPDSQTFDPGSAAPMLFGKGQFRCVSFSTTASSGQQNATGGALWAVERSGAPDPTKETAIAVTSSTQVMYTLIHEAAHSIDYVKGLNSSGFGFSETSAWLSIAGWKKNGSNYVFTSAFKYPSELSASDPEPPCTIYGHSYPWEDFAESWTFFVFAPEAFKRWYPKRHAYFTNNVVPFLNTIRR